MEIQYEVKRDEANNTITIINQNPEMQLRTIYINTSPKTLGDEQVYEIVVDYLRKNEIRTNDRKWVFKVLVGLDLNKLTSGNEKNYITLFINAIKNYAEITRAMNRTQSIYIGHLDENGNLIGKSNCISEAKKLYPEGIVRSRIRNNTIREHQLGIVIELYNRTRSALYRSPNTNQELLRKLRESRRAFMLAKDMQANLREQQNEDYSILQNRLQREYLVEINENDNTITIKNTRHENPIRVAVIHTHPITLGNEVVYEISTSYELRLHGLEEYEEINKELTLLVGVDINRLLSGNQQSYLDTFMGTIGDYDNINRILNYTASFYVGEMDQNGTLVINNSSAKAARGLQLQNLRGRGKETRSLR